MEHLRFTNVWKATSFLDDWQRATSLAVEEREKEEREAILRAFQYFGLMTLRNQFLIPFHINSKRAKILYEYDCHENVRS